ncbi:protein MpRLK-Pelle_URK-Pp-1a [Marchantia polymorpha subsp. ruderalis]|uniref:non-specific serine/threonine protein kinase n=4 Tax=Marchantia polymorpha TaxID=3197 RepID=A0AAF6B169_MARPO|nr:hypothetical protein MARPO_0004s0100 [Marchantia polymorpha]BBN05753.1 hypothetical protein Mp_3g15720 [Marchantia polymorpha subsp. ruderalis]|eukprot:PTQ48825.1 hypothetical protein MARPO_0004s0100 [Marchantia polymorpha]
MARSRCTAGLVLVLAITAATLSLTFCSLEEGVALHNMMTKWNVNIPSWTPGSDPCDGWELILCTNGRVTSLNLTLAGISGELPEEIGVLTELETLDLSENDFRGSFPDSLANCQKLRVLDVQECNWNVPFPSVFLKLSNLEYLSAASSGLSGRLPEEFYAMKSLKYIYLGNNTQLTGNLESFTLMSNLVNLTVWSIKFDDYVLPEKLSTLKNLQYFNCHDCNLHGGLPESYGDLTNLIEFNVRRNYLTGGIPESFKKLTKMENFRVDTNSLLGPFPNWMFSAWPKLSSLYISRNQFYGTPYNISYLETRFNLTSRFKILRWDCNYLEGNQPCGNAGGNNCSIETVANTVGEVVEILKFAFNPNCYDDVPTDIISQVGYCNAHTLTCDAFYNEVVNQKVCPACPSSQTLAAGSTVDSGCLCHAKGSDSGSGFPVNAVVGLVVGLSSLFIIILGLVIWKRRKHFSFFDIFSNKEDAFDEEWEMPASVHRFSVEELARITEDFNDSHIIGHGGFGKVYAGTLDDGRMVAIKRASAGSLQGVKEFRNEVTLLSRLHHRHLVRLEGFCAEKEFQVLVYEFMKKGNLATHLYGDHAKFGEKTKLGSPLPWYKRLEIAYGVAQGLEYLHSFADPPVIHRDVKPSNILLDEHMMAKLADFGISKESPELDTHISTRPAGTAGYLDPEYFLRRQLTTASDVYAYGVVLLELVTGQVAIDHTRDDEYNLVEWAKKRFRTAGIISIIDPSIADDYSKDAFTQITELALRCSSFSKNERPTMKEVIEALDPLIVPKSTKSSSSRTESSSFTEKDWLLAKKDLFRKLHVTLDSTKYSSDSSLPSTGSDVARTFNVMDMSQDFAPRG